MLCYYAFINCRLLSCITLRCFDKATAMPCRCRFMPLLHAADAIIRYAGERYYGCLMES